MTSVPGKDQQEAAEGRAASGGGRAGALLDRGIRAAREGATRLGRQRLLAIGLVLVLLVSPWPPLTLAALAAYALVTLKTPGLTTALIPLAFPFAYRPKDLFGPDFPVVELLLLVALATSALQLLVAWQRTARSGSGSAAILDFWDEVKRVLGGAFGVQAAALALIATFSLFTVADQAHLRESLREYRTIVVEPILYFFLARHWLRARGLRQLAIGAFVGGATMVGLLALGQVATGQGIVVAEGVRRALGTYRHPNALALYLERVAAFNVALVFLARAPRRSFALLATLPVLGAAIMFTFSRGAFVGLAVALAALGVFVIGQRRERAAATPGRRGQRTEVKATAAGGAMPFLAAVAAVAILAAGVAGLTLVRADSDSLGLRQLIWRATLAMIRDHPAFGVGLDQFVSQYAPRYIRAAAWDERFTSHPHNLFLDFWVRLGIMGLAWVTWTLGSLATRLARAWQPPVEKRTGKAGRVAVAAAQPADTAADDSRRIVVAAGVACIAALVHGLLDNFYFLIDLAFVWWLLLALVQTGTERRDEGATEPVEGW